MKITTFRRLFEPNTRADLNWDRLVADGATVKTRAITSRKALGDLLVVWGVTPSGGPGNLRNPADAPMTLREAVTTIAAWPTHWERVQQFRRDMLAAVRDDEPLMLTLPVYAVGDRLVILDSTHRAVAAYSTGLKVRVVLLVARGPVDNGILPYMHRLLPAAVPALV